MGDLIDLNSNPVAKLKAEIQRLETDNASLTQQLIDAKNKIGTLVSVNEMLKVALHDLQGTLILYRDQLSGMINNLGILRQKLPDIDSRIYPRKPDGDQS